MHFANSFIKLLTVLVAIDFLTGVLGAWFGLEHLAPNAETVVSLWLPLLFFFVGTWMGLGAFVSRLRPTYSGSLLLTVNRLGDAPIALLVILAPPVAYSVGNPILATLQGIPYSELISNVQGAGPLMVMFGLVALLSSLRLMQLLIVHKKISWSRALLITAAALWVFGPRKAALFSAFAPIGIYLWLNHEATRETKLKIGLLALAALITAPLVDILRYGDEAELVQFIIQLAGGLAPTSSIAPQTLAHTADAHCTPNAGAMLGNLYYFVPRALWTEKPAILPNSNYLVTTEVLGLDDSLSISGSLLSESLLLTCFNSPVAMALILFFEGLLVGLLVSVVLRTFFGALGFWTILLPLQFAMFREGIGLYAKDVLTNMVLLMFVHVIVMATAPRRRKTVAARAGAMPSNQRA